MFSDSASSVIQCDIIGSYQLLSIICRFGYRWGCVEVFMVLSNGFRLVPFHFGSVKLDLPL